MLSVEKVKGKFRKLKNEIKSQAARIEFLMSQMDDLVKDRDTLSNFFERSLPQGLPTLVTDVQSLNAQTARLAPLVDSLETKTLAHDSVLKSYETTLKTLINRIEALEKVNKVAGNVSLSDGLAYTPNLKEVTEDYCVQCEGPCCAEPIEDEAKLADYFVKNAEMLNKDAEDWGQSFQ